MKKIVLKKDKNGAINYEPLLSAGFIPVWKTLPEIDEVCLIVTSYGKMDVCRFTISEDLESISWVNDMRPQHSNGSVIAWKKLPVITCG